MYKINKKNIYLYKCMFNNYTFYKDEYILTSQLPYPEMLGKGCAMWDAFRILGLYDNPYNIYQALSSKQVLEITSHHKDLNNYICMNSNCNKFISKMLDGTYKPIYKDEYKANAAIISNYNGEFILEEGKHRVCAAKRFNLEKFPATVYYYDNDYFNKFKSNKHIPYHINENDFCIEITKNCKNIYNNLGLSDEDIKELNENITDDKYLEFIENKIFKNTSKTIVELIKEKSEINI